MTCTCGHDHTHPTRPAPQPGQIALSGRLICADFTQLAVVLEFMPDHVAASRAEPGCLFFDIAQSEDPLIWQVEELYTDEAALAAHKARTADSIWAQKSAALTRDIHRIDG